MPRIIEYRIENNLVCICDETRSLRTYFPDGSYLDAAANDDAESVALARDLGYENTWDLSREHEIIHTLLATLMGQDYSPTLWTVVHRDDPRAMGAEGRAYEEWLVIEFQKYMNTGLWQGGPPLRWLAEWGYDVQTLRTEAIERFRDGYQSARAS